MSVEDRAQEQEVMDWERNNRPRGERPVFAPGEAGYGPAVCAKCEDDMPAVRRAYGYVLCVVCAAEQERTRRSRRL